MRQRVCDTYLGSWDLTSQRRAARRWPGICGRVQSWRRPGARSASMSDSGTWWADDGSERGDLRGQACWARCSRSSPGNHAGQTADPASDAYLAPLGIDPNLSSLLAMLSLLTCRRQAVRVRPQQLDWFRSRCPVHRVRCRGGRVQSGQRPALPRGRKPREDRPAS